MHQRRGRILLVDGDAARAERLANRLSHLDLDIHVETNGAAGLLRAHEVRPEMVIAATVMPILDGYRMLEALRDDPETSRIPVTLITEGSSHEELARGWSSGADLCIPRNQGEADVLATLHRALSSLPSRGSEPRTNYAALS